MTMLQCPLPDVSEALRPYIHSRQETLRIREAIGGYLLSHIASETPPTRLNLAAPSPDTQVRRIPAELIGLRREYLTALRANIAAQHRYVEASSELDALRHERAPNDAVGSSPYATKSQSYDTDALVHSCVSLRRLRRLHRQLRVIEDTVGRLADDSAAAGAHNDMAPLVEQMLGNPPQPPATMPDELTGTGDNVEQLVDGLKKQVLEAKNGMLRAQERQQAILSQRQSMTSPSLEVQVAALRIARDALVEWIEAELGKIAEGDTSELSTKENGQRHVNDEDEALGGGCDMGKKMQELYAAYTAARKELVDTMNDSAASRTTFKPLTHTTASITTSLSAMDHGSKMNHVPLAELLPRISTLVRVSRDERSLMQQSSYLRRNLAMSTEQTQQLVRRLADESHMVTPGASSVEDWTVAAEESARRLEEAVREWVREGNEDVTGANDALAGMGKGGLGSVQG